jgi:hypothetical protein
MSEKLSAKADLALSELTSNGGLLNPVQNDVFIQQLMDQPTMLRAVRTVPMNGPTMKINKINFGQRILHPATQTGGQEDTGVNDRWLVKANRSSVQTEQVSLSTKEVIAEVRIPYEVLEDNIEQGSLADTILAMIAERAALDLEELLIMGDTASGDAFLAVADGILKMSTLNIVDATGQTGHINTFNNLKKALPTRFRRNLNVMNYFSSMDFESDYRVQLAGRQTPGGDSWTTTGGPLPVMGVGLQGVALMPMGQILFANPQNFIFGIQRNVRIEQDRDIRAREVVIVLTARIAIAVEEKRAIAKAINVGAAGSIPASPYTAGNANVYWGPNYATAAYDGVGNATS